MRRFLFAVPAVLLLCFCFSQDQHRNPFTIPAAYAKADQLFTESERLPLHPAYDEQMEAREASMNREALSIFQSLLSSLEKNGTDSICQQAWYKTGILYQYFDSLDAAAKAYRKSIQYGQRLIRPADSVLFQPYLFTGSIFYTRNQFDSALYYYQLAEQINDRTDHPLKESQRLYNRLGALYYETGNYSGARIYFEKALGMIRPGEPFARDFAVNYKVNIGSALVKMEEYEPAGQIFRELLQTGIHTNEILNNLGVIALYRNLPDSALYFFNQVNYDNEKKTQLFNHKARAWTELKRYDSATACLDSATVQNARWYPHGHSVQHGITCRQEALILEARKQFMPALRKYQDALIGFANGFTDTTLTENPKKFNGAFAYIHLFNTLADKARLQEKLYEQNNAVRWLESSLDSWKSAFDLADYVERTYNSDEARLFLNKIKYIVHTEAIRTCLTLYHLQPSKKYLADLYRFDQQNKASILTLNLQENEIRRSLSPQNSRLNEENAIKSRITRLSLKAGQTRDSLELDSLENSIRDAEISLTKLREQISRDPAVIARRNLENIPSPDELIRLLDPQTALLSYHLSEKEMVIWILAGGRYTIQEIPLTSSFYEELNLFKSALQNTNPDEHYAGAVVSQQLYQMLIAPAEPLLDPVKRLIIIPDDELNEIPFEALQNEKREYLVSRFAVTYQYSTALLGKGDQGWMTGENLAMAPFASGNNSIGRSEDLLPASGEEISNLSGLKLLNQQATRAAFLQEAPHYPVIHLATHAQVNNEDPGQSVIRFSGDSTSGLLYAKEIYDLRLDSVQLVILSACETGSGQLVRGEGLMSLSRAFAYAGCHNIITSLWKAEDRATAFITSRLHIYLQKKMPADKALQLAKLDLLRSTTIDPGLKSPNYWAHLVFIGEYSPEPKTNNWRPVVLIIAGLMLLYILYTKIKPARSGAGRS